MNCSKCNAELLEGAKFCAICGTKVPVEPVVEAVVSTPEAYVIPESIPVSTDAVSGFVSEESDLPVSDTSYETEELVREPVALEQPIPVSSAAYSSAPVSESPKKEKKPLKVVLIALAVVGVIAIIAVVAVLALSGVFSPKQAAPKPYLFVSSEDEALVFYGSEDPTEIKGEVDTHRYSVDGTIMAMTIEVDEDGVGELILCTGKDVIEVSDEAIGFSLSGNGQKLAYFSDYDEDNYSATLSVFDLASKKSTEIAEDVYYEAGVVFSPDGKTMAYLGDPKTDDAGNLESRMGYLSKNGEKPIEIGKNKEVIAVSDNASYIYYIDVDPTKSENENELYVKKGENEEKLGKASMDTAIYFNQDCSEVVFTRSGSTYISIAGADKEKISGDQLYTIVFPENTRIDYSFYDAYAVYIAVPTLQDQILILDDDGDISVGYLDKKLNVEEIDSLEGEAYNHDVTVSSDGKSLCFIDDSGAAQLYKNFRNLNEKPIEMDPGKDLISIQPSKDFSKFYLIDENNTMFLQIGSDEALKVFDDVDESSLIFSGDESRLYFLADMKAEDEGYLTSGSFYVVDCKNGAKPEEIADEASYFNVSEYGILYYVYDKTDEESYVTYYDAYYSKDGEKFKSVMDEAI